jgi:exodeoxyribonuclease VII small subunit
MDATIKDFEAAIAELETIVKKLEEGDLALETSLKLYERGVHLSRFCHAQLEQAEKRIEFLNERGELKPAPANFAADDPPTSPGASRAQSRDDESEGRGRR